MCRGDFGSWMWGNGLRLKLKNFNQIGVKRRYAVLIHSRLFLVILDNQSVYSSTQDCLFFCWRISGVLLIQTVLEVTGMQKAC